MKRSLFNRRARRGQNAGHPIQTGTLNNGSTYEIHQLGIQHLDAICEFHETIHAALHKNERTFISKKSREDFEDYLQGKGVILGVICNKKLVAMGALLLPTGVQSETGTADMKLSMPPQSIAVLQSDSVLPEYRGNHLQQKLSIARIGIAAAKGRKHILALADTKNLATIKSLLNSGLAIVGMGIDPDDGGKIFHMRGIIQKNACKQYLPLKSKRR